MILRWLSRIFNITKPPNIRLITLYEEGKYKVLMKQLEHIRDTIDIDYIKNNLNTVVSSLYNTILDYQYVSNILIEIVNQNTNVKDYNLPRIFKKERKFKDLLIDQEGYIITYDVSVTILRKLIDDLITILMYVYVENKKLYSFNSIYIKQYIINMLKMIDELGLLKK